MHDIETWNVKEIANVMYWKHYSHRAYALRLVENGFNQYQVI